MRPYARNDIVSFKTGEELLQGYLQTLPTGPYWEWKARPESNLYKYYLGIYNVIANIHNAQFYLLWRELSVLTSTFEGIAIWEAHVGIPDEFITTDGQTLERRQYNVLSRLRKPVLVSRIDFINFLLVSGFEIGIDYVNILNGLDAYWLYTGFYNQVYNIETLTQSDTDTGCIYLILNTGGVDNQNIINIVTPLIPKNQTFKIVYII